MIYRTLRASFELEGFFILEKFIPKGILFKIKKNG